MNIEFAPLYKAFLLTELDEEIQGFSKNVINNKKYLYISEDYSFTYKKLNDKEIYLLGYCMDIRDGSSSEEEILTGLLSVNDKGDFHDEVEYLNGRFTIIYTDDEGTFISTDATSMKPVFHNEKLKLISSHEYIIKKLLTEEYGMTLTKNPHFRKGFLDFTYNYEILKLNPSLEVRFEDFNKERIFPRGNKGLSSLDDAYELLDPFLKEILKWLKDQPNKMFSLTGGQDSRLTLAVLKPLIEEMEFFTYLRPKNSFKKNKVARKKYLNDKSIVQELVSNLNLKHEFFHIPNLADDDEYYQSLSETMSSNHSYGLSKYYTEHEKFHYALHIKSTIQSVAKSSFPKDLYVRNDIDSVVEAMQMWSNPTQDNPKRVAALKQCIKEYMDRNKLTFKNIHDYHILDMLFLEVRLGNFQSNITLETDNTLEIFNIVNSRKMIEILLSPKLEERQVLALNQKLINGHWPVLNFFGINESPENLFEQVSQLQSEMDKALDTNFFLKDDIEIVKRNNLTITRANAGLIIRPKNVPLLPEEGYPFEIINHGDKEITVSLTSTYKNTKGSGVISLVTNDKDLDILKLNKGLDIKIPAKSSVKLAYEIKKKRSGSSWKNAATIIIRA